MLCRFCLLLFEYENETLSIKIMSSSDLSALAAMNGNGGKEPISQTGLKALFTEQREFMNFFFENLDYEPIEKFCAACLACKGVVFFSGVGKSGFIAQKISMTLVSTGTKAVFLNPTDALHGDIGILSEEDMLHLEMLTLLIRRARINQRPGDTHQLAHLLYDCLMPDFIDSDISGYGSTDSEEETIGETPGQMFHKTKKN